MAFSIAIDGHAGAGKGTLAGALAEKLGYLYLDTGAMFRSVAYAVISQKKDDTSEKDVADVVSKLDYVVKYENGKQKNLIDGVDVSPFIRTERLGMGASNVSKFNCVREKLLKMQRDIAGEINVILEGRDIGTVVLPKATLKIFLTASPEERAKRRLLQYGVIEKSYQDILADIKQRDFQDSHRAIAPLRMADDSVLIDSTTMTISEVTDAAIRLCKLKGMI